MKSQPRTLADQFYFGGGPRWRDDDTGGRLWFSDSLAHRVYSVDLAGNLRTELDVDRRISGLGWMPDGSLLVVMMETHQVWRRWPDGRLELHADLTGYSTFLCNDMVADGTGRAYVSNYGFDVDAEIRMNGVVKMLADHPRARLSLVQADGSVSDAAPGELFDLPNGMVITPDGKTLIVAETLGGLLTSLDIGADGTLSNRREWATTQPRMPDGICLDAHGAVWIANLLASECARIAPGGDVLEVISAGELPCYACMLGGPEGRHLFMFLADSWDPTIAAKAPNGKVLVTEVDLPRAGWH